MTFSSFSTDTDTDSTNQKEAEAKALAEGERLLEAQAKAQEQTYEQAREAEESQLRFAGKYKSAEDLEKAYLELQKKLGEGSPSSDNEEDSEPTEDAPEEAPEETEGEVEPIDTSEGVKLLESATAEYYNNESGMTPETYEKLCQLSGKEMLDSWIAYTKSTEEVASQQAINQADVDRVMTAVGGQNEYNQMLGWANDNLNPTEVAAYNAVVASNNPDAIYWAALGLKSKYTDSVGYEGKQITGKRAPTANEVFRSHSELARAINNPKYRDDPAYRRDIEDKLARSGELL
jgi:hypothetical protein